MVDGTVGARRLMAGLAQDVKSYDNRGGDFKGPVPLAETGGTRALFFVKPVSERGAPPEGSNRLPIEDLEADQNLDAFGDDQADLDQPAGSPLVLLGV